MISERGEAFEAASQASHLQRMSFYNKQFATGNDGIIFSHDGRAFRPLSMGAAKSHRAKIMNSRNNTTLENGAHNVNNSF